MGRKQGGPPRDESPSKRRRFSEEESPRLDQVEPRAAEGQQRPDESPMDVVESYSTLQESSPEEAYLSSRGPSPTSSDPALPAYQSLAMSDSTSAADDQASDDLTPQAQHCEDSAPEVSQDLTPSVLSAQSQTCMALVPYVARNNILAPENFTAADSSSQSQTSMDPTSDASTTCIHDQRCEALTPSVNTSMDLSLDTLDMSFEDLIPDISATWAQSSEVPSMEVSVSPDDNQEISSSEGVAVVGASTSVQATNSTGSGESASQPVEQAAHLLMDISGSSRVEEPVSRYFVFPPDLIKCQHCGRIVMRSLYEERQWMNYRYTSLCKGCKFIMPPSPLSYDRPLLSGVPCHGEVLPWVFSKHHEKSWGDACRRIAVLRSRDWRLAAEAAEEAQAQTSVSGSEGGNESHIPDDETSEAADILLSLLDSWDVNGTPSEGEQANEERMQEGAGGQTTQEEVVPADERGEEDVESPEAAAAIERLMNGWESYASVQQEAEENVEDILGQISDSDSDSDTDEMPSISEPISDMVSDGEEEAIEVEDSDSDSEDMPNVTESSSDMDTEENEETACVTENLSDIELSSDEDDDEGQEDRFSDMES